MGPHSLFQVHHTRAFPLAPQADKVLLQEDLKVSFDPGTFQGSLKS